MRPAIALLLAPLLLGALSGCDRKKQPEPQPAPAPAASTPGVKEGLDRSHAGEAAPAVPFETLDGKPATLAAFRGKPLLVNLWATWCAPCVVEMPQLDALAAAHSGTVASIAISQNLEGRLAVDPFWKKGGYTAIEPFLDKQNVLMLALKQENLPITILYDAKGKELWRVTGKFDWSGAQARALLAEATA